MATDDQTAAGYRVGVDDASTNGGDWRPADWTPPELPKGDAAWIGTRVGRFEIESVIASGGMGTVFKATQVEPVRRPVALKMIKSGMADEATVNRFFAERQALALMDHPDIARVYEADATSSGNPYFAMEYCEGLPIDQYCAKHQVPLVDRIELVIRIARAVQRAHAHGVIHRDLKPANVLVSPCEGRPNLKVIDFGIAKFTDAEMGGELAGATRIGEMIGTPAYMSPEQAAGRSIDARTDVFAMGAILFKLLTGTTPLTAPPEGDQSLGAILSHIQSFQSVTPTRRFIEADQETKREWVRSVGLAKPSQWMSTVRGDLDWITLRAIDPDKIRRYATADDFADDLQRHLSHQPVVAAAPSKTYRLQKFYQRRRIQCLAAGVVTVTLFVAGGISGWSYWGYEQERRAEVRRVASEVELLLGEADGARNRAANGGPNAESEFAAAKTAIAQVETLLSSQEGLPELTDRLEKTQSQIRDDQSSMAFTARLNAARERAAQVDSRHSGDAFGRLAGLHGVIQAYNDFGVPPVEIDPGDAAERLVTCPQALHGQLIESLDFLLNEDPTGAGLYLHHQGGRVTIAEVVPGGAADKASTLRAGDRILAINEVDLIEDVRSSEMRCEAYRLLSGAPGEVVGIRVVRGLSEPIDCEIVCSGATAHWAHQVLADLDADPWRTELRRAILDFDLPKLRQLSRDQGLDSQTPWTLIQLSGALFLLERSNEAIRLLELAQQRYPESFWANHYLGTALVTGHQPPLPIESVRYLTAAVSLRPDSVGARINLAESLTRIGKRESALNQIRIAADMMPDYQPLRKRIGSLSSEELTPVRIGSTESVTRPGSHDAAPLQQSESIEQIESRARKLAADGKRDQALALIRDAEERFSGDPKVRRAKGIVLIGLQDFTAARVVLSDAARLAPNDAAARFYYGVSLQYSGDSRRAIHEYEAALQIRPDYEAVREFLNPLLSASER